MQFFRAGQTLYYRGPRDSNPHLWFLLTNPDGSPERILAVMLSSVRSYSDPTLILQPGDHPFIKHPSSVSYGTARFFKVARIPHEMKLGLCHLKEDMSHALLERVREGLLKSPFTVPAIAAYCKKRF